MRPKHRYEICRNCRCFGILKMMGDGTAFRCSIQTPWHYNRETFETQEIADGCIMELEYLVLSQTPMLLQPEQPPCT